MVVVLRERYLMISAHLFMSESMPTATVTMHIHMRDRDHSSQKLSRVGGPTSEAPSLKRFPIRLRGNRPQSPSPSPLISLGCSVALQTPAAVI